MGTTTYKTELNVPLSFEGKDDIFYVCASLEYHTVIVPPDGETDIVDDGVCIDQVFACTPEGDEVELTWYPIEWKQQLNDAVRDEMQSDYERHQEDKYG